MLYLSSVMARWPPEERDRREDSKEEDGKITINEPPPVLPCLGSEV